MNNAPTHHKNLWGDLNGKIAVSYWQVATQAWQDGRYLDSFYGMLDYINPDLRKTYGNISQTSFSVPHGSVIVNISLKDDHVEFDSPFVDTTGALRIPLLRKVAELNFYPMELATIRMKEDKLHFQYKATLDTSEPYKTYMVLKEICRNADRYDDDFREKFKTKNIVEPKVKHVSAADAAKVWANVNDIVTETLALANYFDNKRWFGFTFDILTIAVKRLDLAAQPQGFLKNEIERVIGEMKRQDINLVDKNGYGRTFLNNIIKMGPEAFAQNLYEAQTFVPDKWMTGLETIQTNMKTSLESVNRAIKDQNPIGASMEALYFIYDLFYLNYIHKDVENTLMNGLTQASGKTWSESAAILQETMQAVVDGRLITNA